MSRTTTGPSGTLTHEAEISAPAEPSSALRQAAPSAREQAAPTRRGAIFAATAGLLATAAACEVKFDEPKDPGASPKPSATPTNPGGTPNPSTPPVDVSGKPGSLRLPKDLDLTHLINRTTFGVTPALLAEVKERGAQAWLAEQLNPEKIADPQGDAVLKASPQAAFTLDDIRKDIPEGSGPADDNGIIGSAYPIALRNATVAWSIVSKRQLHQRMAQFWTDHFNVTNRGTGAIRVTRTDLDVQIRRFSFGKFSDFLQVVAEHPAMLSYLSGADNTAKKPNENFAREIMELHTLGIDGGYNEDDVLAAAKLLSGWSQRSDGRSNGKDQRFAPEYTPKKHAVGPVKIMDFRSANATAEGGLAEHRKFYAYLAKHPSTAKHLSTKLAKVFVADEPPAALIDRMAKVYLDSDTQIVPVLCEMFSSPEFAAAAGKKTRRPREYVVAALRVMGAQADSAAPMAFSQMMRLNPSHEPFTWATPDGFPITADQWTSPGVSLEIFNAICVYVRLPSKEFKLPGEGKLLPPSVTTVDAATAELTKRWFGRAPADVELRAARTLIQKSGLESSITSDLQRASVAGAVGVLLLQSPSMLSC